MIQIVSYFFVITSVISTSINECLLMGWHLARCNTCEQLFYLLYSQDVLFIYYTLLYTQGLVYAGIPQSHDHYYKL